VSDAYLVCMGLSFSMACVGIVWSMYATVWGETLDGQAQQKTFAAGIRVLSIIGESLLISLSRGLWCCRQLISGGSVCVFPPSVLHLLGHDCHIFPRILRDRLRAAEN
jgi:hypothetical protein